MKKFKDKNFAYGVAVLLAGAMAFSACSSDEEVVNVNPSFDGESVKTQFAINVAGANKNATRMSADNTQNNSNYLGMANVRLFTLEGVPGTATALTSDITLVEPTSVTISNSSHIYTDVNIPVETNNFLFYSTRNDLGTDLNGFQQTGAIVSDLFATSTTAKTMLGDITFKGKTIKDVSNINAVESAFIAYLNGIVTAFGSPAEGGTLKSAKDEFIKNFSCGQRAGSAFAILKQVDQLWEIAKGIPDDDPDNTLAKAVVTAITGNATIKIDATGTDLAYDSSLGTNFSNFPIAQGLPDGSMLLTYDTNTFKYTDGTSANIGGDNKINMNNIMFPLPIVYFDNTPAKASNSELKTWPTTTTGWDAGFTGWDSKVTSSTRAIALENNINYGVASLKTTVKCGAATLEDNAYNYTSNTIANQVITVPDDGFTVSGLLVGGQPKSVGWEMVDGTTSGIINRDYVVYDNQANSAVAQYGVESAPIYTLVFDNWNGGTAQENVNVAIELVNNGNKSFYAQDGIVEIGQRFYLIGKLELNDGKKADFTWPAYGTEEGNLKTSYQNRYPVKATDTDKRIFIQDYTTTANFTINSLQNAYVTIPDLRASKLQLGLSVDLEWKNGITFDVEIQ